MQSVGNHGVFLIIHSSWAYSPFRGYNQSLQWNVISCMFVSDVLDKRDNISGNFVAWRCHALFVPKDTKKANCPTPPARDLIISKQHIIDS